MTRRKILAITTSPLPFGDGITDGPGYRMWNLLPVLAEHHDVRVLGLYESFHLGQRDLAPVQDSNLQIERPSHTPRSILDRIRAFDPDVLYLPWSSAIFVGRGTQDIPTIIDYVGPGLLESYLANGHIPFPLVRLKLASFWYGDYLMTTTDRERYYLLGLLAASGRLSERGFPREDPLIQMVRMTPPLTPPPDLGHLPPVRRDALTALLAGAFLPWYDYSLLAEAMDSLDAATASAIRVLIAGGSPRMPELEKKVRSTFSTLAQSGKVEFRGLLPFRRRLDHYRAADVAISVAPRSVEDELSARTRIVDYLWARLPILTDGRDEYSAMAVEAGAGFAFDPNARSLGDVLSRIRANPDLLVQARDRIETLMVGQLNPRAAAEPVLRFIENPRVSPRHPPGWLGPMRAGLWLRDIAMAVRRGRM